MKQRRNQTVGQVLTPTRLAAALAGSLLMLASPAGQGAVSLSGPYWSSQPGAPWLGPGNINLPTETLVVGAGAPGSFAVGAGSQVDMGRLNLGARAEAHAVFDGPGTRVGLHGDGYGGRLEIGHNAAKASLTVSGGALLDGRASAAACLLGPRWCFAAVGSSAGSDASFTITGVGSRAAFVEHFLVGGIHVDTPVDFGNPGGSTTGRVQVLAGGLLETEYVNAGVSQLSPWALGSERSHAVLRVDGAGSTWRANGSSLDSQGGVSFSLAIGPRATAQAEVLGGGLLEIQAGAGRHYDLRIGNGGDGTLTVAGADSLLRLAGDADRGGLHIAEGGGSGVLTVRDGATLDSTARWTSVGERGGNGRLTVTGAGSTASFASGSGVSLGDFGSGRLEVLDDASLATGQLNIGRQQQGSGSMLLDGAGSRLGLRGVNMERLYIGNGDVTVSNGALLDARLNAAACDGGTWCGSLVGAHAGARGSLTVTGAGSTARFLGSFQVGVGALAVQALDGYNQGTPGEAAVGILRILDGGLVQADRISAGLGTYSLGATGTESVFADLRISGPGSTLQLSGGDSSAVFQTSLWNARNSVVNVAITGGGQLRMEAPAGLSSIMALSSSGGVTDFKVSGAGSAVIMNSDSNSSLLQVGGNGGMATMSFSAGAQLSGVNSITVGNDNSLARLSFDGAGTAGWLAGSTYLVVGARDSQGILSIANGATLGTDASAFSAYVRIGAGSSSQRGSGSVNISGAGSALSLRTAAAPAGVDSDSIFNPVMLVGDRADGVLRISQGGRLSLVGEASSTAGHQRYTQLNIGGGYSVGGSGQATVTGAGSLLQVLGQDAVIWVGNHAAGQGQLSVLDGARLESTLLHLGSLGGIGGLKLAAAEVRLAGQWSSEAFGAALVLGKGAGSQGSAGLSQGALLTLSNAGAAGVDLSLGGTAQQQRGSGLLTVTGASTILLDAAPGLATVHIGHSGSGIASFEGGSQLRIGDGSLYIGRQAGAVGTLTLAGGSRVEAGYVGVGSTRDGDGGTGTLIVSDSTLTAGLIEIGARGFVGGAGALVGNIVNRGVFSPGNSPGTLTIDGSFVNAAGGRIELEVESDGQGGFLTDKLLFAEGMALDLGGVHIDFRFLGATDPNAFQASGGFQLASFFATSGGAALDPALFASASYGASADAYVFQRFSFTAEGGATFTATPVPEPGQWQMLLAGLALLAGWRRRSSSSVRG